MIGSGGSGGCDRGGDGGNNTATDSDVKCKKIKSTKIPPMTKSPLKLEGNGEVARLQDITNYIQSTFAELNSTCSYDNLIEMIRGLSLQDDGIQMNNKIKFINLDFCAIVRDENTLRESIVYINNKVLDETLMTKKFAVTFSARQFDDLAIGQTTLRSEMLNVLNRNYLDADLLRQQNRQRFYNSITLLGEYYQRVRLQNNTPIDILGQSLLEMLINEISDPKNYNDVQLFKLILTQISINGEILRSHRQNDLTELLYLIRKNIIEKDDLQKLVKALSLMTLDTHYLNLCNLGEKLEGMYMKYYIMVENGEVEVQEVEADDVDDDEHKLNVKLDTEKEPSNNDGNVENGENFEKQILQVEKSEASGESTFIKDQPKELNPDQTQYGSNVVESKTSGNADCAVDSTPDNIKNDADDDQNANGLSKYYSTEKKWSDEVWDDDAVTINYFYVDDDGLDNAQMSLDCNYMDLRNNGNYNNEDGDNSDDGGDMRLRNSRRSYHTGQSPRPLKQYTNAGSDVCGPANTEVEECDDDKKPLPRWRVTRFNRNSNEYKGGMKATSSSYKNNNYDSQQRAISGILGDNQYFEGGDGVGGVREDGAGAGAVVSANGNTNIRLYSINDRLKYAQEKIERNTNRNQYNGLATSNWDCQSQRDDKSERSYQSNYERGHNQQQQRRPHINKGKVNTTQGNGNNNERRYNNWNVYEKPPRFQKQQRSPMKNYNYNQNQNTDGKIGSESWRRRSNIKFQNDNDGKMGQSYNSYETGAQTLPRRSKSTNENNQLNYDANDNRRSYSPAYYETSNPQQQAKGVRRKTTGHFTGNRYNSQNSLTNEATNTNYPYQYWQNKQQIESQNNNDVNTTINKDELLCDAARQTTKYMTYLSTKK